MLYNVLCLQTKFGSRLAFNVTLKHSFSVNRRNVTGKALILLDHSRYLIHGLNEKPFLYIFAYHNKASVDRKGTEQ